MKKYLLFLTLILAMCSVYANGHEADETAVQTVVQQWNALHNSKDIAGFGVLYADEVFFYGHNKSRQQCVELKQKFLLNNFSQQIVSRVSLTWYDDDLAKCDFDKQATYYGKVKLHHCYLLVKKRDGRYLITGESEYAIDEKNGTSPILQSQSNNPITWTTLSLIAIAAIIIYYFIKSKKQSAATLVDGYEISKKKPAVPTDAPPPSATVAPPPTNAETTTLNNEEKGKAFENYVTERFDKGYFKLKEWRGDKYHKGIYAESNKHPDIEWEYLPGHILFATECKWRASFIHQQIEWAKEYQLKNYQRFATEKGMVVFIIIGVGGLPHAPEAVYIVPLDQVQGHILTKSELQPYQCKTTGKFFLNADEMRLG